MAETTQLSATDRLDWLRLIRSENVGPITFYKLLERFGTATKALDALPDLAKRGGRGRPVTIAPKSAAEDEIAELDKIGAKLICHGEEGYPPLLTQAEDAPPLISVLGHPHLLTKAAIAVVGARNASLNGRKLAHSLCTDLGKGGLLVVSGLARGIDTSAHEGSLETGSVAIVAGGVDVVYPKENQGLYERLVAEGAVVSEMPPATKPQARHFPRRNRIISGMARGVLVVEASPRSGSLITARMALDQGREIFAVPGSPLDGRAAGTNNLIREGATLVESAKDILDFFKDQYSRGLQDRKTPTFQKVALDIPDAKTIDQARNPVLEALGYNAVTVDELISSCQLSPAVIQMVLLELELAGRLDRQPGQKVSLLRESE